MAFSRVGSTKGQTSQRRSNHNIPGFSTKMKHAAFSRVGSTKGQKRTSVEVGLKNFQRFASQGFPVVPARYFLFNKAFLSMSFLVEEIRGVT